MKPRKPRPNPSRFDRKILRAVPPDGAFAGIADLAAAIHCNDMHYFRSRLRLLTARGFVIIEYPSILHGRGYKRIIRRGYVTEASES